MDHNHARRPHYHRGRRGPDRRGGDRRAPQQADAPPRASGDQVDVEQIMRDIRARIAQRHGIDLSTPQIHELAARRLEAILDPRNVNPSLMEQLRRGAAAAPALAPAVPDPGYTFEDSTLYESHRGLLRVIRRLLNPLLKLFFNPNPLIHALHTQSRLNREAAAREAERERLQTEWNALHYEVLQRLVAEVSRVGVEVQALSQRVESLSARVDFNDRRVRVIEGAAAPARAQRPEAATPVPAVSVADGKAPEPSAADVSAGETTKRRRRRRRGRRGGAGAADTTTVAVSADEVVELDAGDEEEDDEASPEAGDRQTRSLEGGATGGPEPPAAAPIPESAAPPTPESAPTTPDAAEAIPPTPPLDEPASPAPAEVPHTEPPER